MEEDEKGYSHRKEYLALEKQVSLSPASLLSEVFEFSFWRPLVDHSKEKF
jgi:hypothetical protein